MLTPIHAMFDGMSKRIRGDQGAHAAGRHDGADARRQARADDLEAFAERVGKPGTTQIEERIHDPLIRIDNDLAVVWAPFGFLVDGKIDHCGADLFNLVRVDGRWMIASVADTGTKTCSAK